MGRYLLCRSYNRADKIRDFPFPRDCSTTFEGNDGPQAGEVPAELCHYIWQIVLAGCILIADGPSKMRSYLLRP